MNMPPRLNPTAALLDQPSGAAAAGQLQQALQQTAASAGALAQPAQNQAMVAQQRAAAEAGLVQASSANLASQLLLDHVANLKRMTGVHQGSAELAALGAGSAEELLARVGMA
jgi:hypothetical protein